MFENVQFVGLRCNPNVVVYCSMFIVYNQHRYLRYNPSLSFTIWGTVSIDICLATHWLMGKLWYYTKVYSGFKGLGLKARININLRGLSESLGVLGHIH